MPRTNLQESPTSELSHHEPENLEVSERALAEGMLYLKNKLKLSDQKLGNLIRISRSTIQNWGKTKRVPLNPDGTLSNDAESLVHLLAVHRSLEAMLDVPAAELEWLNLYNDDLEGKPIEIIARSFADLIKVRTYLDYMRGRAA